MNAALFPAGIPKRKRVFDLLLAVPGLLVLSPLLAGLAILIRLRLGRPVLFRQTRPGYRGQPFTLYKFRTMTDARNRDGRLLSDAERLTALGRFLRSFSLDDLPNAFNVLRGQMSVVGPRPLLMEYLDRYTREQARRHDVLPGITGWAQVNGRNDLSWEDKFRLDVWYVDHWSLRLDMKVLALTAWKVLQREGISQAGYATAPEFPGTSKKPPPD